MKKTETPGLKTRKRADGTIAAWWVASNCSRRTEGFEPRTIPLNNLAPEDWPEACRYYHQQLMQWVDGKATERAAAQARPTIATLIDFYVNHEISPYAHLKHSSRQGYDSVLGQVRAMIGEVYLEDVGGIDILTWHAKATERHGVQGAHSFMAALRRIFRWGVVLKIEHAKPLTDIISEIEFPQLPPRTEMLSYDQAQRIVAKAHEQGRSSIAFAQALQFELTMRQGDVIGEWLPGEGGSGIQRSGRFRNLQRWDNGLTWSHIGPDMVLRKLVNKTARSTGTVAQFDLRSYPLVMAEIERIPAERRVGPLIVNEATSLPYIASDFRRLWREIANLAGVPRTVQNRDSRAGGITEATDAGAGLEMVRHHSTHKNASMTARYSRPTPKKNNEVARLRVAARKDEAK